MDIDWFINAEVEAAKQTDSDTDDEREIMKLDAALEEADIQVCDETSATEPVWESYKSPTSAGPSVNIGNVEKLKAISQVESALCINRLYDEKVRRLERILVLRLRECRVRLEDIQKGHTVIEKEETFRYVSCGRPYFRDQFNFPAPDNQDTITMRNQMYDFSLITTVPGWTVQDKNLFTSVMIQTSIDIKKKQYNQKIDELNKTLKDKPNKRIEMEIAKLKRERDSINTKVPFVKLALPLDEEYDWEMLSNKLNGRHTAHEFRCLWRLYFHPSINKSCWKNTEHQTLQTLAASHCYQDWDTIARNLNTGRTGYQCFVYFRTNVTCNSIGKKWTQEEITYLKRLVEHFKEGDYIPWGKIAAAVENRTKLQIYNKYMRIMEQRKGRFLPEEDAVILNCVGRFGTNFRKISEYLAHRSIVQIRARYQVLSKMRVSTVWSVEDDKKLIQVMANMENMDFANATQFFPGRNRVNIRSRFQTLDRWMKKNPHLDIEHAPRRGARRLNHGQASNDIYQAIENLKNTMNAEVEVKKGTKKITRDSDDADIEDAIVATLVTERVKEQEQRKYAYESPLILPNDTIVSTKALDMTNLHKCLLFLSANLNKDVFNKSCYKEQYPSLGNASQDVNLVKIKSYSKKNSVQTFNYTSNLDIWGTQSMGPKNYVMPPHYATISGCKALMSHVTSLASHSSTMNLHILVKRNSLLKDQMDQLLERFYTLFLWPMLLSNEGPVDFHNSKLRKKDSFYVKPPPSTLPQAPEVTINYKSHKKFNNSNVSDVIDVNPDEDDRENVTVKQIPLTEDDITHSIKNIMK